MKCLLAYHWVKVRRDFLPAVKGIMGSCMRLASRAAFRKGQVSYCGHTNAVEPGTWAGGIVGVKSILNVKTRQAALDILNRLAELGYIEYDLNPQTKKLTYRITDWVVECCGKPCLNSAVYTTDGYGFVCVPRSIMDRLLASDTTFEEADAWLDLWVHTVWHERSNAFSGLAPVVQFDRKEPILTLETLGKRWHWEKTKVWRFLHKHRDTFDLCKLPGAYGCLIFNSLYPTSGGTIPTPNHIHIVRILDEIRICGENTHFTGSDHDRMNRLVLSFSRQIAVRNLNEGIPTTYHPSEPKCRVALSAPYITRVYISQELQQCQRCYLCSMDCRSWNTRKLANVNTIRGPGGLSGPHSCRGGIS